MVKQRHSLVDSWVTQPARLQSVHALCPVAGLKTILYSCHAWLLVAPISSNFAVKYVFRHIETLDESGSIWAMA